MAEARYDIFVNSWSCVVTNQNRKAFGGHKIRQRTVMHLRGTVDNGAASGQTAGVYLVFQRGAQRYDPTVTLNEHPDERVRVDVYLMHGQEAATLAILQAGYRAWARFEQTAMGQASFTLESGAEPRTPDSEPV